MNGKKRYVAIVLFLIIGLGSFVFASPEEENGTKKENDKTVQQQGSKEPVSNDDEFETEEPNEELVENDTTNNNVITNPTNPVVDNSYALALAAVKELEEILNDEKANTATELVEKVTNQTQKEALAERVENAKNAITAEELVSELEDMVANATSKDNLISALGFRDETTQPAVDKIGGDQLAGVKEELTKRIDDLAAILEDNEAPIIEASTKDKEVVNTGHYNKDVTVTVKDAVVVTVTKDGSDYGFQDKYTENGTYVVLAVDEALNEAELQFTIDKVKPKIKGVSDGAYYNTSVTPIIEEENVQNVTVKKDGNKYTKYTVGASLTEDGTYQMRMTDKAGNKFDYITFVIDTKAATVESVTYTPNTLTNGKVTVTITYSEEIKEVTGWTLTDDKKGIYREFDENITSDVTVFDLAGNETKQAYEVKNIDKVLPTLTITYNNGKTEVRGSDNITTNLRYVVKKGETLVDDFYGADRGVGNFFTIQWHASTYGEGEYTVTVYDEAGNYVTTTAMVDVTKPTLTITNKNGKTEVRGSDNITTNLRYIIKKGDVLVDDFYGADRGVGNFFTIQWHAATYGDGEYTVEVIDEVGNSTKDTAIVDTTKPEILFDSNPIYVEKNSKVDSISLTAKVTDNIDADKTIEPVKIDFISIRNIESLNKENVDKLDSSKEGTFKVYYETTDNVGNKATAVLDVVVRDTREFKLLSQTANTQDNYKTMIGVIVTNKEIKEAPAGWSFSLSNPTVITKKYTANTGANGEDVEVYDLYGNKLVINVVITEINELVNGSNVVLKEDTTLEDIITIAAGQEKVIDLNDKTLTVDNTDGRTNEALIKNAGKLTIKNGKIDQSLVTTLGLIENNGGEVILDDVEIVDKGSNSGTTIENKGGKLTILNSKIETETNASASEYKYGNASIVSDGELVVKNTKITGDHDGQYAIVIYDGTALIEDVTIDHLRGGLSIYGGNVTLNNNKIIAPKPGVSAIVRSGYYAIYAAVYDGSKNDIRITINGDKSEYYGTRSAIYASNSTTNKKLTLNINDGYFEGYGYKSTPYFQFAKGSSTPEENYNINIKGGTFKKFTLNEKYIVDGYKQVGDNVVPE